MRTITRNLKSCHYVTGFTGFDRHLLGLYLIAKEEGRPTPELFMDPLYAKRYNGLSVKLLFLSLFDIKCLRQRSLAKS